MIVILPFGKCQSNREDPTAPAETVPLSLVYTQTTISFSEPRGEIYDVQNGWMTKWDGVGYCFAQETMTRATGWPGGPWGTPTFAPLAFCRDNGILVETYSPVAHGEILKSPEVRDMAEWYGVSVPQLCIRYDLQLGTLPLPKAANPRHMADNAGVDFEISAEDMEVLKAMKPLKDYGEYSFFPVFSGK